tara:strand:+ start:1269 stop:2708 length:1440 start_codon:yes stop_codon:yes gene_type:complete
MLITNLKELQSYREFQTIAGINQVRTAVVNNVAPAGLTQIQTNRFNQKFLNNEWQVVNTPLDRRANPAHGVNRLIYRPNNRISLIVAYPDEREIYMNRIFRDRKRGMGVGLQAFYYQVALSYLNIQKKYTDVFLRSKGNYEIQKQPFKKVVRPIISKTPNERWNMDLIDMSIGVIHRYILSVVDNFSGFLWTRRLLNRTAQTIVNTLQEIINANYPNGSNGTYPRLLQSDNGGEFSNALMTAFCNNNNIQQILSLSHHPSANGKVERKNREIRKKIKAGFIRQNANNWNATMLKDYTKNINNQVNAKTKLRAIDLYSVGFNQQPAGLPVNPVLNNNSTQQQMQDYKRNEIHNRAVRLTNGRMNAFNVGDLVRVSLFNLSAEYREIKKSRIGANKIAINYSPVISRITNVYPPNNNTTFVEFYSIAVGNTSGNPPPLGEPTWTVGNIPILFSGNQLVPAGNQVSIIARSIDRANQMNRRN